MSRYLFLRKIKRNDEDFQNVKGVEHSYPLTDCVSNVQPEMILNERKTVYRN